MFGLWPTIKLLFKKKPMEPKDQQPGEVSPSAPGHEITKDGLKPVDQPKERPFKMVRKEIFEPMMMKNKVVFEKEYLD